MAAPTLRSTVQPAVAGALHAQQCLGQGGLSATPVLDRADPWLHQLAASLAVPARSLAELRALMAREGFTLELSRFFLDLAYAYRQLAIAHSLGVPRLRTLALELFEACQRLDQRRRELTEPSRAH
jgi:ABC-type Fe3+ transport system permease subunit